VKVVAVYNIKGGVGKTATAVNLSWFAARGGARTLIWDLDPQGAACFYFRVKPKVKGGGRKLIRGKAPVDRRIRGTDFPGLDLLPADFSYRNLDLDLDATKKPLKRLRKLLAPFADEYDYIFIDCAPSISKVSESVFYASDALLVPTIPTHLSLRTLSQLKRHLGDEGPWDLMVLPFFAMVDRRKSLHRRVTEPGYDLPFRFLDAKIPYASVVERMGEHRSPLGVWAPRAKATTAYRRLFREVDERMRRGSC